RGAGGRRRSAARSACGDGGRCSSAGRARRYTAGVATSGRPGGRSAGSLLSLLALRSAVGAAEAVGQPGELGLEPVQLDQTRRQGEALDVEAVTEGRRELVRERGQLRKFPPQVVRAQHAMSP